MKCIAYTEDLPAVIEKRSVDTYPYADDGQLNVHLRINDVNAALQNMETCVGDVQSWCASERLQLNPSKTEVIRFGIRFDMKTQLFETVTCVTVSKSRVTPTCVLVLKRIPSHQLNLFVTFVLFSITN